MKEQSNPLLLLLGAAFWFCGVVGFGVLYTLPTLIAALRRSARLRQIAIVNVLLGWSLIGWWVALVLSVQKRPTATLANSEGTAKQPRKGVKIRHLVNVGRAIGLASSISAVVGVFLVYDTLKETKNGNVEANRAYVEVKSIDSLSVDSDKSSVISMSVANPGKEPARDVTVSAHYSILRNYNGDVSSITLDGQDSPCTRPYGKGGLFSDNPIEINWDFNGSYSFKKGRLSKEDISAMKTGSAVGLIYGCISYFTFAQLHWTHYCSYNYYDAQLNKFYMHPCPVWNDVY